MMQVTVKFYSLFKSLAGVSHTTVQVDDSATIESLLPELARKYPELPLANEHICFLVSDKIARREQPLKAGDQITVFEMFAGG